ncbi:MAG: hypothetical protein AB1779_07110 [Candidatus Thermoplasmatota archaeon]
MRAETINPWSEINDEYCFSFPFNYRCGEVGEYTIISNDNVK